MAFTWLQQITLLRLSTRMSMSMSTKFFEHTLRLPLRFFDQRFAANIVNRIGLNDEVASLLSSQLASTLLGMLTAMFYLTLMAVWDWQLTLVAVFFATGNILALRLGGRRQRVLGANVVQENGKLISTAAIGLMNIEAMKASSEDASFFARWAGQQAKLVTATQEIALNSAVVTSVPQPLAALNLAVLLGFGGWQVMHGGISLGTLVAFEMLVGGFNAPIGQLIGFGQTLRQAAGNLTSIDDVMAYPEVGEVREGPAPPTPVAIASRSLGQVVGAGPAATLVSTRRGTGSNHRSNPNGTHSRARSSAQGSARTMELADFPARLSGSIEFVDVTFGYDPLGEPLIKGLRFKIGPGQRTAVVGRTGSGKSTVAKLVAGLNRPWSGEVLIAGLPRGSVPPQVLANTIALVDQDIRLFEGTVRDNLTLWDSTVPEGAIIQAARDARIHDDVARRPGGYDRMILEGGADWSGGQRQRLEIARALTGAPSILVLDEATAALDPLVEAQIDQALRGRGLTCLIVAHRLSTIRDCDEIIVLDGGKVAERGRHEDLMQAGSIYSSLVGG
jgi:ATP-binding cassette subfamily C protein